MRRARWPADRLPAARSACVSPCAGGAAVGTAAEAARRWLPRVRPRRSSPARTAVANASARRRCGRCPSRRACRRARQRAARPRPEKARLLPASCTAGRRREEGRNTRRARRAHRIPAGGDRLLHDGRHHSGGNAPRRLSGRGRRPRTEQRPLIRPLAARLTRGGRADSVAEKADRGTRPRRPPGAG